MQTELDNVRAKFKAEYALVASYFMAKSDIRYYLCGLHIEAAPQGGVYVVGCDGHTIGIIYDATGSIEGGGDAGITIQATPALMAACRKVRTDPTYRKGRGPAVAHVVVEGQRAYIGNDVGSFGSTLEYFAQSGRCQIEGKYPDWKKILPNFSELKRGVWDGLNINYLARYKQLVDPRYAGVSLWQSKKGGAAVVQYERMPELISLIMPMRDGANEVFNWPHLLQTAEVAEVEKAVA